MGNNSGKCLALLSGILTAWPYLLFGFGLSAVFSVASFLVGWYVIVLLVGNVPTDHPAGTWWQLGVAAFVVVLAVQPIVVGWLYGVSRLARQIE